MDASKRRVEVQVQVKKFWKEAGASRCQAGNHTNRFAGCGTHLVPHSSQYYLTAPGSRLSCSWNFFHSLVRSYLAELFCFISTFSPPRRFSCGQAPFFLNTWFGQPAGITGSTSSCPLWPHLRGPSRSPWRWLFITLLCDDLGFRLC